MNLQAYNILVIDDDKTFGESLKAAISRVGFRCYLVSTPEDALAYIKLQDVQAVIIDCMLPKMNGLDLFKHISAHLTGNPCVMLMSGIFKDKQFINSSKQSTGASHFFTKPFNVQDIIAQLRIHFGTDSKNDSGLPPLLDLYLNRDLSPRKVRKTLNLCQGLHNYDLPWVFRLLFEKKANGHLNILCTNGDIGGVGFLDGNIVQGNIKKEESLLGLLLCEQGFLDRGDLDIALKNKSPDLRIGQSLIHQNFVSPHAIDVVVKEQIVWRMRRLIADSQMEINFVPTNDINPSSTLTSQDLEKFIYETIETSITGSWLKTHYMPLFQNIINIKSDESSRFNHFKSLPFVAKIFPAIEGPLNRGTTLEELLSQHQQHEEVILKALHYLNISNCLTFSQAQKNANLNHQLKKLQRLEQELEGKNYFERLGLSSSAKDIDIKRAYHDLAKVLHPDKSPPGTPDKVLELSRRVFEKIQIAYDTLKKEESKETYTKELEVGKAEKLIRADQVIESARHHLSKGETTQAIDKLNEARSLNANSIEMQILSIWCDIKATKAPSDRFRLDIEKRLQQIPLEARDTPSYYHTRGIFFLLFKDSTKAAKYFNTALKIDPTFINSRRELNLIKNHKANVSIFKTDLKDVVGMFFKKK